MSAGNAPPLPTFQPTAAIQAVSRTSGAAIASMILGLLGCVPFITGMVAVALGLVGINATKNPLVKGRGMALAGLILGSLSLVGWGGTSASVWSAYSLTRPERDVSRKFMSFMVQDNADAALVYCAGEVSPDDVNASITVLRDHGKFKSITIIPTDHKEAGGINDRAVTQAFLNFEDAKTLHYRLTLVKENGKWKVSTWAR